MSPNSRFRRLFLLYRPVHPRAWARRLLFYLVTFFLMPLFALAALGAYFGPDETLAGVPAVVATAIASLALRRAAIFADGSLRSSMVSRDRRGALDQLTFSLREPPPRHPLRGRLTSAVGALLLIPGFYGWERIADRGVRLREWGRRLQAIDGRALLRRRPNDPIVLLLRSFEEEEMREARPWSLFMRRYEERLSRTLGKCGPVITIGRPGEEIGYLGAGRLYVSDADWQPAVRHFMRNAGAIVIIVGGTEGLWWEISEVLTVVRRERVLFIFPYAYVPERSGSGARSEFHAALNLPAQLRDKMDRERRDRYQKFRQRTKGLIAEGLPQELGNAICGFRARWPGPSVGTQVSKRFAILLWSFCRGSRPGGPQLSPIPLRHGPNRLALCRETVRDCGVVRFSHRVRGVIDCRVLAVSGARGLFFRNRL